MIRQLQPANSHRICPPGVSAIALGLMLGELNQSAKHRTGESPEDYLVRLAAPLVRPPDEFLLVWRETAQTECLWLGGGAWPQIDMDRVATALSLPVFRSPDGMFTGEEGGLGLAEFLDCPSAMVADLGQTALKISWAGRRCSFLRDRRILPFSRRQDQGIAYKGRQRRALRNWVAGSIRQTLEEAGEGVPGGIVFAIPSMLDEWGRPAGSSYAGMQMDTQLVPDALRLAGLPNTKIWLLNDAELAAASAIFDERVIRCGGKALVFTLGTAVGCAVADPLAAALHFAGISSGRD